MICLVFPFLACYVDYKQRKDNIFLTKEGPICWAMTSILWKAFIDISFIATTYIWLDLDTYPVWKTMYFMHCCRWYVATWEHWCQKAFSRVSDEPGIETEDKMYSMHMFQFLTASAKSLSVVLKFFVLFFTSARWSSSPFFHEPFHSWLHKCTMVFMRMLVVALVVNNSDNENIKSADNDHFHHKVRWYGDNFGHLKPGNAHSGLF